MRRDLALEYGIALDAGTQKYREDPDNVRRRSFARALIGSRPIPEKRRSEMLDTLAEHLECGSGDITTEMLEQLACTNTRWSLINVYINF